MSGIDKKTLEHLATLARLKLDPTTEEKMLNDLGKVLEHFEELKSLNTESVAPLTGGTELKNILRDDSEGERALPSDAVREALPETEDGFLKIPPVFE